MVGKRKTGYRLKSTSVWVSGILGILVKSCRIFAHHLFVITHISAPTVQGNILCIWHKASEGRKKNNIYLKSILITQTKQNKQCIHLLNNPRENREHKNIETFRVNQTHGSGNQS